MPLLSNLISVLSLFSSPQTLSDSSAAIIIPRPSSHDEKIPSIAIGKDVHGDVVKMPLVGAGTWQYNDTVAYQSVCKAFQQGYTFVDTAYGYGNQQGVGQAIQDCFHGTRDELFVMTKIPGGLHVSEALAAHQENLLELQLDYVDHLMVHYPSDWSESPGRATRDVRQEEWLVLENIYYKGEARSIGISHYCEQHIDNVLQVATVTPSINQVEYHVGAGDVDHVIEKCRQHNITFMSYSPLCGPCQTTPQNSLINGELVSSIAKKYNVTGPQVSLRFIVQQALQQGSYMGGVIPKSNNEDHIRLNRDLFHFELSQEDMSKLLAASEPAGEAGDCSVP